MSITHIIAPFIHANGGDWSAIDLYLSLKDTHQVKLWSEQPVHDALAKYPINIIKPYQSISPNDGHLIVVGPATSVGKWYEQAKFKQVTLINNLYDQDAFFRAIHRLSLGGKVNVSVEYVSEMVRRSIALTGIVKHPLPHPERFKVQTSNKKPGDKFVVGKITSNKISKHHQDDIALYQALAGEGIEVRIYGGKCLTPWLNKKQPNIQLLDTLPASQVAEKMAKFDCFYYRVSSNVREAFGLVVAEALMTNIPVVAFNEGGYCELEAFNTEDTNNKKGFLFNTNKEALKYIQAIRDKKSSY